MSAEGSRCARAKSTALRLLGIHHQLDSGDRACKELFEQAHLVRDTVSLYRGSQDAELVGNLTSLLDKISSFEKVLDKQSAACKAASTDARRERVESLTKQLVHARLRFQEDISSRHNAISNAPGTALSLPFPIEQVPAILPAYLVIYVGHQKELDTFVTAVVDGLSTHVVILGGGGMGKTTLATKCMQDSRVESKFGNLRFFINCDGVISAEAIVACLASVFRPSNPPPGTTPHQGLQALLTHLRALHVPMLIVLDNLESAWDTADQSLVEAFLSDLCSIELLAIVVTLRGTQPPFGPVWHESITLQPLNQEDAHTLFTTIYPESAIPTEDHSLRILLGLLDGLPLAIVLLASVGRSGYIPSKLLRAYREERTALAKRGRGDDRLMSLEVSITVSLNCRTMKDNPEALKLLALLALLPDGLDEKDYSGVFPSMTHYSAATRVLVQVALCTATHDACRVLAPIRTYIQVHYPPCEPHLSMLRRYHFGLADRARDWTDELVRNDVGRRIGNIQAVLAHAIETRVDAIEVLPPLLSLSYFTYRTFIGDCKPYLQLAISMYDDYGSTQSRKTTLLFPLGRKSGKNQSHVRTLLADCKFRLGEIMQVLYDHDGATAALKEARAAFESIGDHLGAAQCTQSLGDIMQKLDDFDRATAALKEARTVFESIGSRTGVAQCTQSLGDIMRIPCDYGGATAALKEARAIFESIGDRLGGAQCTRSLGDIMRMVNDYDGATAALTEAKAAFESIGSRRGAAQCAQSLGDMMRMLHDNDGATVALKEAKAAFESIGDRHGAAQCTQSFGNIMRMLDDYDGATTALKEAKAVFESLGGRRGAAQCTQSLGDIMRTLCDYGGATAALKQARAAFETIGDRLGAAQCTWSLGDVMQMLDDYDGATATLKKARAAFETIGDRRGAAQCRQTLGEIMWRLDDYDGAMAALKNAKTVFESIRDHRGADHCAKCLRIMQQWRETEAGEAGPGTYAEDSEPR